MVMCVIRKWTQSSEPRNLFNKGVLWNFERAKSYKNRQLHSRSGHNRLATCARLT